VQASYRTTHEQENFFFDGSKQELSSQRVVLRVRFYGVDKKAVITLKVRGCVHFDTVKVEEAMSPSCA